MRPDCGQAWRGARGRYPLFFKSLVKVVSVFSPAGTCPCVMPMYVCIWLVGRKKTMRGSDSDATYNKSTGRQRPTEPGKTKKYCWPQPSIAGNSKLVTRSTKFNLKTLKMHDSKKHKTYRDQCMTQNTEPLPTSFQRLDERNIQIKFRLKYFTNIKSLLIFTSM